MADAVARRDRDAPTPLRAGRHRHRQDARLPRPRDRLGPQDGRRDRDEGAAGPARDEGPAVPRAHLGRDLLVDAAEGTLELRVPPARRRGAVGRGRAARSRCRRGTRPRSATRCADSSRGPSTPRPAIAPSSRGSRASPRGRAVSVGWDECPGALRCPMGDDVPRRGRPGAGRGSRRRGREHPPLRHAPRDARHAAARARGRRHRRGAPARGGRVGDLGHRARTEPLPLPRPGDPFGHRRSRARRRRSTTWPIAGPRPSAAHLGERLPPPLPDDLADALALARTRIERASAARERGARRRARVGAHAQGPRAEGDPRGVRGGRHRRGCARRRRSPGWRERRTRRGSRSRRSTCARCSARSCGRSTPSCSRARRCRARCRSASACPR